MTDDKHEGGFADYIPKPPHRPSGNGRSVFRVIRRQAEKVDDRKRPRPAAAL
jgi:hypothetical protein